MAHSGVPYRLETIRGTPIRALGRTLVPVARVTSVTRHGATIRARAVEGRGAGYVRVRPLHVIEMGGDRNVILPIRDLTARTIAAMVLAAAAIALVSFVLIVVNRLAASSR
jgi:uncharacterized spore protein YtfJ